MIPQQSKLSVGYTNSDPTTKCRTSGTLPNDPTTK